MEKQPYDLDDMMSRIRSAVQGVPKAALFELAEEGFDSPFEQLLACIVSIQTLATARRVMDEFGGKLPCDQQVLMSFSGVGLKCANLTLGIACGQPVVSA